MKRGTNEMEVDVQRLVRLVVDETVSRAEQACRYALKHQNFSGEPTTTRDNASDNQPD